MEIKKIIRFILASTLIVGSAKSAMAAGVDLPPHALDNQCSSQYGPYTQANMYNPLDPFSWKCKPTDGPSQPVDVSAACRRTYGSNYFGRAYRLTGPIDSNKITGWRCVRKWQGVP